jgi:hypothetical protein
MVEGTQVSEQSYESTIIAAELQARFPNDIRLETRMGYEGILVNAEKLREIALVIRDDYGFNYLSNACAVDYLGISDHLEMVYHAYRVPMGGPPLVFKAN